MNNNNNNNIGLELELKELRAITKEKKDQLSKINNDIKETERCIIDYFAADDFSYVVETDIYISAKEVGQEVERWMFDYKDEEAEHALTKLTDISNIEISTHCASKIEEEKSTKAAYIATTSIMFDTHYKKLMYSRDLTLAIASDTTLYTCRKYNLSNVKLAESKQDIRTKMHPHFAAFVRAFTEKQKEK
jgi:hypothetical protein